MTINNKYKLGDVAKDLNVPVKELVDLLSTADNEKKRTTALSAEELNRVFETYTRKNSVENFDSYFASGKKEEKKAEKTEEKQDEKKVEAVREVKETPKQNKTQTEKPQKAQNDRPQGEKPQRQDRPQGERRPAADRAPRQDRPQGERKPFGDKAPRQDRPQGERKAFGDRPQGNRDGRFNDKNDKNDRNERGDRRNDRPQGDRKPFGDKAQNPQNRLQAVRSSTRPNVPTTVPVCAGWICVPQTWIWTNTTSVMKILPRAI